MSTMLNLCWWDNKGCLGMPRKVEGGFIGYIGTCHFIVNSSMGDVRSWRVHEEYGVHVIVLWKTTIFRMKHNGDHRDENEHVIWGGFRNNIIHMGGNDNCNAKYDVTLANMQC